MTLNLSTTSAGGIQFEELEGSPRIRGDSQGITAVRMFRVDWGDYTAFVGELAGLYRNIAGSIVFDRPLPFPGGNTDLLVDEVEVEPFDGSNPIGTSILSLTQGLPSYSNGAKVTATYRQRFDNNSSSSNPSLPDGTYLTYESEEGVEYMTVPGNYFKWSSDNVKLPDTVNPGIQIPVTHHKLTWHNVLSIPETAMTNCKGHVNDATFYGKPTETMLLTGIQKSTAFAFNNNQTVWRVTYTFSEKNMGTVASPKGWNCFFRYDANPNWQAIVDVNNGAKPYTTADFTSLFSFT